MEKTFLMFGDGEGIFFSCVSSFGNFRWILSKWNKNFILINVSFQAYLIMIFWWYHFIKWLFCVGYILWIKTIIFKTNKWKMSRKFALVKKITDYKSHMFKLLYSRNYYFVQFLYMLIQCLTWRPIVKMFQTFFPIFSGIILPLIINWWYICFI